MGFVVKVHPKTYEENKTNWVGYLSQQLGGHRIWEIYMCKRIVAWSRDVLK
jgi:hypothetical protein